MSMEHLAPPSENPQYLRAQMRKAMGELLREAVTGAVYEQLKEITPDGEEMRKLYKSAVQEAGEHLQDCPDCHTDRFVTLRGKSAASANLYSCLYCGKGFTERDTPPAVIHRSCPAQEIIDQWDREAGLDAGYVQRQRDREARRRVRFSEVR
jgi:hypothetical protein